MIARVVPIKRGAVSLPFFDYLVPEKFETKTKPGMLCNIPLRKKIEMGVILEAHNNNISQYKLKEFTELFDVNPIFSIESLNFYLEISEIYHTSLGSIFKSAMPPIQKRKLKKSLEDLLEIKPVNSEHSKPELIIYKNLAERTNIINNISKSCQTLLIVPDITEAENIFNELDENKKHRTVVISSNTSEKNYYSRWFSIRNGEVDLIIGTRNALLIPFFNLKEIIIDQNSHFGHKSWDAAPRFSSKDIALLAARHLKAKISFIGHTASVEDYFFAKHNIYKNINEIPTKIKIYPKIINQRQEFRAGNFGPISIPLEEAISENDGNTFIYCNKKGSYSHISCRDCGNVLNCPNCNRSLTYFENTKKLTCRLCGFDGKIESVCSKCQGTNISFYGSGIENIYQEVKKIINSNETEVIMIEKEDKEKFVFEKNKKYIVVGTQAAWNQIDWSKYNLVAFADPDVLLHTPEYQISEELWRLLRDAAIRMEPGGSLFVQTNNPEHFIFESLSNSENFYIKQLSERKLLNYPPYKYLLKIFNEFSSKEEAKKEFDNLLLRFNKLTNFGQDIRISPPLLMVPGFVKGKYWYSALIKLDFKNYKKSIKEIVKLTPDQWKVDPNPISILGH